MQPDSDRPLIAEEADLFGFVGIAKRLAPAILKTVQTDGVVIALEGPWGSGKTTLLNFLRKELDRSKPKNVHVISIAPWLGGDKSNLVSSLLAPIAEILDHLEDEAAAKEKAYWKQAKKKGAKIGDVIRNYGARTGRILSPAARLAEYFVPGAKIVGDGLDLGSDYLEKSERNPTTAEIKSSIAKKISEMDVAFVVILDDLDRLEPDQAVEVVRVVKSVADFSKITYLMCYDRDALSHALKSGLNVNDGDLFLQKIVQLSFSIPLPEPFDLRANFLAEAKAIFREVNGIDIEGDLLDELKRAVDREGSALRTPREVKLALNGLRFLYPSINNDVYYPDICRLHLIKTTRADLYRWIEKYLADRSVLVTGDATISKYDKEEMGKRLLEMLPADDSDSVRSIWNLRRFVPGVVKQNDPSECVFANATSAEVREMVVRRRLGSPIHYRYYFALTFPKTVIPDEQFDALLKQAKEDISALREKLVNLARDKRSSGRSWFEHVLDRFDYDQIRDLDVATILGLIEAISDGMDEVLVVDNDRRPFLLSVADIAERVVRDCFKRLKVLDAGAFLRASKRIATECRAINWLVKDFFRTEVYAHGLVGDRKREPDAWLFSDDLLSELLAVLKKRASLQAENNQVSEMPELAGYLYGWRDLSGLDEPKKWVEKFSESDEGFLFLLQGLRGWAMSDKVYYPLNKSAVSVFLDWEQTIKRLNQLTETEHSTKARELLVAVEQGRD